MKKLAPLRAKKDATHALQMKLQERINKNRDEELKKIEGQVVTYNSNNYH